MFDVFRLAFARHKKPAHQEEPPKPKLTPVGIHPILDQFAMITLLVEGQSNLWEGIVRLSRFMAALSIVWAFLALIWGAEGIRRIGQFMGWW